MRGVQLIVCDTDPALMHRSQNVVSSRHRPMIPHSINISLQSNVVGFLRMRGVKEQFFKESSAILIVEENKMLAVT